MNMWVSVSFLLTVTLKLSFYKCRVYTAWLMIIEYTRCINYYNLAIICLSSGSMMQWKFRDLHVPCLWDRESNDKLNGRNLCGTPNISWASIPYDFMQIQETDSIITVETASNRLHILLSYSSNKTPAVFQDIFYPVRHKILL